MINEYVYAAALGTFRS